MIPVSMYVHWRARVRIHARAARANVRVTLPVQRWRPNGCTDRGPNWFKHSLGQSAQFTRVGDRECAFMRALRAQTCTQQYISSVGAQTAGLNETPIGTNTHWGNRHKLWESACAVRNYGSAVVPRERARSARVHEWNMCSRRERDARVCGARSAHRGAWSKKFEKSCGISEST
jgi:hypothetical protein